MYKKVYLQFLISLEPKLNLIKSYNTNKIKIEIKQLAASRKLLSFPIINFATFVLVSHLIASIRGSRRHLLLFFLSFPTLNLTVDLEYVFQNHLGSF